MYVCKFSTVFKSKGSTRRPSKTAYPQKALESASYEVWYMHVLNFVECVSVLCMPSNIVVKTHA